MLEDDWEEFLAASERVGDEELAEREAWLQFDDAINIQYTSGTTGFPKGATLTHHNILNNAYFTARTLDYSEADRACVPVPFYHCFGMVLGDARLHHARGVHRRARGGVRSGCRARDGVGRALHLPLRRAHDVHRRARASRVRALRPLLACARG